MKCPYCNAEIDNNSTECPSCGKLITANIKKEFRQYEKSLESSGERAKGYIKSGKDHVTKLGSKSLSNISANGTTILWVLGWIFIFPIPALIMKKKSIVTK